MQGSPVEQVGDSVRRPAHPRSAFVAAVLSHVRTAGFAGAPLATGFDERGRQVFEWIDGEVPQVPPFHLTDEQLMASARLVRDFHDAAASLPDLGAAETVEHGDLGPHNTVFRAGVPIALIDWDESVRPGSRVVDFAQAVWSSADLLEEEVPVQRQGSGLGIMCTAYDGPDPVHVLGELAARFDRARREHASAGRLRAVAVFDDLQHRLAGSRTALLAAAHRATTGG